MFNCVFRDMLLSQEICFSYSQDNKLYFRLDWLCVHLEENLLRENKEEETPFRIKMVKLYKRPVYSRDCMLLSKGHYLQT